MATKKKSPLHMWFHWIDVTKDTSNEDHTPASCWCSIYLAKAITLAVSSSFHYTLTLTVFSVWGHGQRDMQ